MGRTKQISDHAVCGCGRVLIQFLDEKGVAIGVTHETIEDEEYHSQYFGSLVSSVDINYFAKINEKVMNVTWEEINKEKYMELVKDKKPIESFSDPEGTSPIGFGRPAMDTIWGHGPEEPICKCEMRKDNRHQTDWEYVYYVATSKDTDG